MDLRHHTAQPSPSRQLPELELELDARLLARWAHGVILTRGGATFLDQARQILKQVNRDAEAVRNTPALLHCAWDFKH
jgi:LysR family hca operon transcriptional activator